MNKICRRLSKIAKLSNEMVEYLQEKLSTNPDINKIKRILDLSDSDFTKEQLNFIYNCENNETTKIAIEGCKEGFTTEQLELYCNPNFDGHQRFQIKDGFDLGLDVERVKMYADPIYDIVQMAYIKFGLRYFTLEQVKIYMDPMFSGDQMYEISAGFQEGLTLEQVKTYADPKYTWKEMEEMRKELMKTK